MNMKNVLILSSRAQYVAALRTFFADLPDFDILQSFDTLKALLPVLEKTKTDIVMADSEVLLAPGVASLLRSEGALRPLLVVLAEDEKGAAPSFALPGAADYLVLPCGTDRLARCATRLRLLSDMTEAYLVHRTLSREPLRRDFVFIKVDRRHMRLPLEDICYVESVKDYIKIVCEKKSFLVYNTLSNFTASLPADRFVRIHRSYTVAVGKIDWIDAATVEVAGVRLPVTKKYLADNLLKMLR